jgi:hypothetical protein
MFQVGVPGEYHVDVPPICGERKQKAAIRQQADLPIRTQTGFTIYRALPRDGYVIERHGEIEEGTADHFVEILTGKIGAHAIDDSGTDQAVSQAPLCSHHINEKERRQKTAKVERVDISSPRKQRGHTRRTTRAPIEKEIRETCVFDPRGKRPAVQLLKSAPYVPRWMRSGFSHQHRASRGLKVKSRRRSLP